VKARTPMEARARRGRLSTLLPEDGLLRSTHRFTRARRSPTGWGG